MRVLDWAIIFGLGIGFGGALFLVALLVPSFGPLTISALRVGTGALGVWAILLLMRGPFVPPRDKIFPALVFGLFMFAIPFALFPLGMRGITAGMAGIVNAMTPIAVVIVSHLWIGGEKATAQKALGVVLGFLGIAILTLPKLQSEGHSELWGIAIVLLAPVSYGIALNYMRKLAGVDMGLVTAVAMTMATLVLVPLTLAVDGVPQIAGPDVVVILLVLGPILTGAFFTAALAMSRKVGPTNSSTLTFIAPISAILLGWAFLDETVTVTQLIGMLVIFAGLLVIDGTVLRKMGLLPS